MEKNKPLSEKRKKAFNTFYNWYKKYIGNINVEKEIKKLQEKIEKQDAEAVKELKEELTDPKNMKMPLNKIVDKVFGKELAGEQMKEKIIIQSYKEVKNKKCLEKNKKKNK